MVIGIYGVGCYRPRHTMIGKITFGFAEKKTDVIVNKTPIGG